MIHASLGPYWVKKQIPIVISAIWPDPFQDSVLFRLDGSGTTDLSSNNTAVTLIPGTNGNQQVQSNIGWNGSDGLLLSNTNGYISIPPSTYLNEEISFEIKFKPTDYMNWVLFGPDGTNGDTNLALFCEDGYIYFGKYTYGVLEDSYFYAYYDNSQNNTDFLLITISLSTYASSFDTAYNSGSFLPPQGSECFYLTMDLNSEIYHNAINSFNEFTASSNLVFGRLLDKPALNLPIIISDLRITSKGRKSYAVPQSFGDGTLYTHLNPTAFTNSSGLGSGWDQINSGPYINDEINLNHEFYDNGRTVSIYIPPSKKLTAAGAQGFGNLKRVGGGKRYFEIVRVKSSTTSIIGLIATPVSVPSQETPYEDPGDYYMLELYDGNSGSCGSYINYNDPTAIYDEFFQFSSWKDNITYGFYVDLDAGRIDKILLNGVEEDAAPNGSIRINTKTWNPSWNVFPFYNCRARESGCAFMLITAGEFRYPPSGLDSIYLPWE